MKKWLSALVAAILCLSMVACNTSEVEDDEYEKSTSRGNSKTEESVKSDETSSKKDDTYDEDESTNESENEAITSPVAEVYKKYPNLKKIYSFNNGLAKFQIYDGNYKYGYIDTNGNVAIEPIYSSCSDFKYGMAEITENEYTSYFKVLKLIDKSGNIVFELGVDNIHTIGQISNGYVAVETQSEEFTGYVYTVTYYSVPDLKAVASFENARYYNNDWNLVGDDGSVTLDGYNGSPDIKFNISEYDPNFKPTTKQFNVDVESIEEFQGVSVYYTVSTSNNTLGEIATVILENRDDIVYFATVDSNGNVLMSPQKDKILNFGSEYHISANCQFYSDMCPAQDAESELWGYIDPYGNWVIDPQYDSAEPFGEDGLAIVNSTTVINTNGDIVLSPANTINSIDDVIGEYENGIYSITLYEDGTLLYYIDQTYGYSSYTGNFEIKNNKLVISGIGYTTYWGINPTGSNQNGAHTIQKVGDDLYINGVKWTKVIEEE